MANKPIYIYSIIPRLTKEVQKRLSDVKLVEVKVIGTVSEKYEKIVSEEELAQLRDAEVLLVDNPMFAQIMDQLPKLKWVQGTWAGVDAFKKYLKDKPVPSFPFSRMVSETFSQLMGEYTIGWILSHERGWLDCRQYQLKGEWGHTGNIAYYRSLRELTVGVLGMGNIGKEVARSLKAFHTTVHAFTRSFPSADHKSKDVDKYWHTGELPQFLGQCDYIVNIMPSTPETRGLLDGDTFKHAKKGAVFMNIGRGDVISEESIIKALDAEWISAAILDVFAEEPLPKESSLWKHPKVVLTPHAAGVSRAEDVAEAFVDNYKRFIAGQQVKYLHNWKAAY